MTSIAALLILAADMGYSTAFQKPKKQPGKPAMIAGKRLIATYHPNGKIKQRGYQGYYSDQGISTGTFVGTWNTYDPNGKLLESIYYHNGTITQAYILKKKYHPNGKIKSVEKFNNYELYESEIHAIGTWQYFDATGKLIKTITH